MSNITVQQGGAVVAQTEEELIRVLQNSLYPGAQIGSVQMVLGYCQAAGLDPMQKPVHIVPMWDKNSRSMRDVVMPGISLYRTQAARTGEHVGTDEPVFGPMVELQVTGGAVTVPEWCSVTVWRMKAGVRCAFVATEYWAENYAVAGKDTTAPNTMWKKRSRGQIAKCAEAQALRKGFPEVGSAPTAEEMEGKSIGAEIDITPPTATLSADWVAVAGVCETSAEVAAIWQAGIKEIQAAGDKGLYDRFKEAVRARGAELKAAEAARTAELEPTTPMTDAEIEAADLARTGDA
jgi:phage recombination protein Bet